MTFYADNPFLVNSLHGYATLPSSEAPQSWKRLIVFDDHFQEALYLKHTEYAHMPLWSVVAKSSGWSRMTHYLRDIADDPTAKVIYVCSNFTWYEVQVTHPLADFQKTPLYVFPAAYNFEGFKDGDIIEIPNQWTININSEIDKWMSVREKCLDLEGRIEGLSLHPYPLTQDDLIGRLADKIRLLSKSDCTSSVKSN